MIKKLPKLIDELYGGDSKSRPNTTSNFQLMKEANFIIQRLEKIHARGGRETMSSNYGGNVKSDLTSLKDYEEENNRPNLRLSSSPDLIPVREAYGKSNNKKAYGLSAHTP